MEKLTWGKLKELVDNTAGVTNDTEIDYIDISSSFLYEGIEIVVDENGLAVFH